MTPVEIISIIGVCIVGIGLIATWVRNGKNQAGHMAAMEASQVERTKTIFNKLDDPNTGLGAIKKAVEKQEIHCASTTGRFDERLKNLEDR